MLQDFLTDQLTFTIAIGSKPNSLRGAQGLANRPEFGGLVAALSRSCGVEPLGAEENRRPALPFRNRVLWFLQVKQVSFGWKDVAIARPDGGADVLRLAGFLSDDDLVGHAPLLKQSDSAK